MENVNLRIFQGLIIISLILGSGVAIDFQYSKTETKLYRNGDLIAVSDWIINAERTSFLLGKNIIKTNKTTGENYTIWKESYYKSKIKCPKVEALGGYRTEKTCCYPSDYYKRMKRSNINTKVDYIENSFQYLILRNVPYYKYGTSGTYAGAILEYSYYDKKTDREEEFPTKYNVRWTPRDTRNYQFTWRLRDLKHDYPDGTYYACDYTFGNVNVSLKDNCRDLNKVEIKGDTALIHFQNKRGTQYYDLLFVDPEIEKIKDKPVPSLIDGWDIEIDSTYISNEFNYTVDVVSRDVFGKPIDVKINWKWKENKKYKIKIKDDNYETFKAKLEKEDIVTIEEVCNNGTCENVEKTKYYLGKKFDADVYADLVKLKNKGLPTNAGVYLDTEQDAGSFTTAITESTPVKIGFNTTVITLLYRNNDSYQNANYVDINMTITDIDLHDMQFGFESHEIDNDLVGWWRFDNSTDFIDHSGNGNYGTNSGTTYTDGVLYGGREFDNNQHIDCGNDSSLRPTYNFSYSFWLKTSDCEDYEYYLVNGGNAAFLVSWSIFLVTIGGTVGGEYPYVNNDGRYCNGNWHYVVLTHDGNTTKTYFDKVHRDTKVLSSNLSYSSASFEIGEPSVGGYGINATMDEVKFYNRSLTAAEIEEQYYLERTRFYDDSLVLMMNFENRTVLGENLTHVVDLSSSQNNGTIHGATYTELGKHGKALSFDGVNDYVDCGDITDIPSNSSFTMELWAYSNPVSSERFIIARRSGSSLLGINYHNNGNIRYYYRDVNSANGNIFKSGNQFNKWVHIVGVRDFSKKFHFYVDGAEVGTGEVDTLDNMFYSGNVFVSATDGNSNYFNGTIDSVRIYNRALTADEINQSYISNLDKYTADDWRFTTNQTNLTEGTYDFYAWVNDTAGVETTSTLYSYTYDSGSPYIQFELPTALNNTYTARNWTMINVTTTDAHAGTSLIDWNNSLVGWWRFNDNSTQDYSSYGNNGTNHGSTYTTAGKFGGAREFDGVNDYVDCGNDASLVINESITLEAWIYPTNISPNYQHIMRKSNSFLFGSSHPDGSVMFRLYMNGTGTQKEASTGSGFLINNQWYHIVGLYNYSNHYMNTYINGLLKRTVEVTGLDYYTLDINANNIEIGRTPVFHGTIDEVKIHNRALSAEEIHASYNAGLYRLYNNFTDLAEGEYTYTAYSQDLAGNVNQTETRTITINDTCICPGAVSVWEPDLSKCCNMTSACNMTTGYLDLFINAGVGHYFNINGTFNMSRYILGDNAHLKYGNLADVELNGI